MLNDLRREFPDLAVTADRPWRDLTTLGIGAACPLMAEPESAQNLIEILRWAAGRGLPVTVLGGGSNLVGSDRPLEQLVVRLRSQYFGGWQVIGDGGRVVAGAALRLKNAAELAAGCGLGGLAPLAGIPGQLGGALRMNAGAHGAAIGDWVRRVSGVTLAGEPFDIAGEEIAWGYRSCSIPGDAIILTAELELPAADPERQRAAIREELEARRKREPAGRSAGCVFRNVSPEEPAGKLIDRAGLKGTLLGGAQISEAHANFILNTGGASADDFASLAALARQAVWQRDGFVLRYEVRFVDPEAEERALAGVTAPEIVLFVGGSSSEREVSLKSGAAIQQALTGAGYRVTPHDIAECRLPGWLSGEQIVYLALHGGFGENGEIQRLLEAAGIDFNGSGSAASALVMDKIATKRLAESLGIPTAKWAAVRCGDSLPEGLKFPVVVKAPHEGSTIGIGMAKDSGEYRRVLAELRPLAEELLVEEFITGVEITVPVVGGEALPVVEIRSPHGFYDYDAKYVYNQGHTEYFCPAESIAETVQAAARKYSEALFAAAGCRDIARVDFIVDGTGVPYLLEANSLPGFTATSLVPKSARAAGISFERLCAKLVGMVLWRRSGR